MLSGSVFGFFAGPTLKLSSVSFVPSVLSLGVSQAEINSEQSSVASKVVVPEPKADQAEDVNSEAGLTAAEIRSAALIEESANYFEFVSASNGFLYFAPPTPDGIDYKPGSILNDTIRGGDDDEYIFGGDGNDVLYGGLGSDAINGGRGDDVIYGGEGRDIVEGGSGYDILHGGADIDVFVFRKGDGTTVLADFEKGFDILDLEGFDNVGYEALISTGSQVGADTHFEIGNDLLILQSTDLSTMVADDLCIR